MKQTHHFKAVIEISGCTTEVITGNDLDKLEVRAIRKLTEHEPGWASCQPLRIKLMKRGLPGEDWRIVRLTPYELIPEEQQAWRKKK